MSLAMSSRELLLEMLEEVLDEKVEEEEDDEDMETLINPSVNMTPSPDSS